MTAVSSAVARRRRGFTQLGIIVLVLFSYSRIRGFTRGDYTDALGNAAEVLRLQDLLGLPGEASVQAWAATKGPLLDVLSYSYVLAHFVGTGLVFVLTYRYAPRAFYYLRDTWVVGSMIALPFYALLPTAPPRLTEGTGLVDWVADHTMFGHAETTASMFYHPYAAVPSMHVGTALLVAVALGLGHRLWVKVALMAYPTYVMFTVVATGNHYWLDGVAGAMVAVLAVALVEVWQRTRRHRHRAANAAAAKMPMPGSGLAPAGTVSNKAH